MTYRFMPVIRYLKTYHPKQIVKNLFGAYIIDADADAVANLLHQHTSAATASIRFLLDKPGNIVSCEGNYVDKNGKNVDEIFVTDPEKASKLFDSIRELSLS